MHVLISSTGTLEGSSVLLTIARMTKPRMSRATQSNAYTP